MTETENNDYVSLDVELNEEHMEGLRHGSGTTFEFQDGDHTLAVHVDREDKELDKDWLMNQSDIKNRVPALSPKWKALVGVSAVMLGVVWATEPLLNVFPMYIGGLMAVLGGIYAVEQAREETGTIA